MFTRRQDNRADPRAETGFPPPPPPPGTAGQAEAPRTAPPPIGPAAGNGTPAGAGAAYGVTGNGGAEAAGYSAGDLGGPEAHAHDQAESVIGQDLTIEGQSITIRCRGALHINGNIEAELHSRELIVGNSGTVQGSITADKIDVWGQVSGAIRGARVLLHASAQVEGDIHAASLSIEDGATFEGRSRKVTDVDALAPQLDADAARAAQGAQTIPLPRSLATAAD